VASRTVPASPELDTDRYEGCDFLTARSDGCRRRVLASNESAIQAALFLNDLVECDVLAGTGLIE
jgi:hypothetical protein